MEDRGLFWGKISEGNTSWWFWGQANLSLSLILLVINSMSGLRQVSLFLSFFSFTILEIRVGTSEEAGRSGTVAC